MSHHELREDEGTEELDELVTMLEIPIKTNKVKPCGGIILTEDNMDELEKKDILLREDIPETGEMERAVIFKFHSGRRLILIDRRDPIKETDSYLYIATYKYPLSWHMAFAASREFFANLEQKIRYVKNRIVPLKKDLFRAFELCPLDRVKVIMVGQDPYPWIEDGTPVACGMSFSTRPHHRIQESLKKIFAEIKREYGDKFKPNPKYGGDLSGWAEQGILLLNTSLTTIAMEKFSHKGYWIGFISNVIKIVSRHHKNLIFLLWGAAAQQLKDTIKGRHHILTSAHPVSYSNVRDPFIGNNHFVQTNELLIKAGKEPIDWSHTSME